MYVDLEKLLAGDLKSLGHMYNRMTGKFKTTQVGSLCNFQSVEDEYGMSLIAEARFPKREEAVCERILELYENNALNFSFEISYNQNAVDEQNGVLVIRADEHNMLTGLAIVSVPAYEEAIALSLVAEDESVSEACSECTAEQEGVETMPNEMIVTEEETPVVQEVEVAEETEAEVVVSEETEEPKPEETEEPKPETEENEEPEKANADFVAPLADVTDFALEVPPVAPVCPPCPAEPTPEEAAELAALRAQIAGYEAEITSLKAEKAELEAYAAAYKADLAARRAMKARSFAEKQGLDLENAEVSEAIASLDFEKLTELALANTAEETEEVAVAEFVPAAPMNIESDSLRDKLFENK